MKKIYLSFLGCCVLLQTFAQAPKYVLFEHFTQASCAPCAAQNPGFQEGVLNTNPLTVRHIAYHTEWPGVDPMNAHNAIEVDNRVSFYQVTGVPHVVLMGNKKRGAPGGFSQNDVNTTFEETSPISIRVTQTDNGDNRDVNVTVRSFRTPVAGNYRLRVAIIEREINYSTPPGTNGEKDFPNVFRKFLPNSDGQAITLPDSGTSVSVPFNFAENAIWDMSKIEVIAFIQNTATKEILNAGSSFDVNTNTLIFQPEASLKSVTSGVLSDFRFNVGNIGMSAENFTYKIMHDAPADWNVSFSYNGSDYEDSVLTNVQPNTLTPLTVNVTPGATPAIVKITLLARSEDNPTDLIMKSSMYVISDNVTDLIVNNNVAEDWQDVYINGLNYAQNNSFLVTDEQFFAKAIDANILTDVKSIYFNMAWTLPTITEELSDRLALFLERGGNMFISGQDIGFELNVWFDSKKLRDFYTNYLGAIYLADGGSTNTRLIGNSTDGMFNAVQEATISKVYGTNGFYPDEINNTANSSCIFLYNNNVNKKAGVRMTLGSGGKVVYMSVGIEMLASADTKNQILKLTHDWFSGLISSVEYDAGMKRISMGQNYPNPASEHTTISLKGIESDMLIQLTDMNGKVLMEEKVAKGTQSIELNTSKLPAGTYLYRLANGDQVSEAKSLQVNR